MSVSLLNSAFFTDKSLSVEMINIKKKSWHNLHNQIKRISQKTLMKLKFKKTHYTIQCRNSNQCAGRLPGQACEQCKRKITKEKEK